MILPPVVERETERLAALDRHAILVRLPHAG